MEERNFNFCITEVYNLNNEFYYEARSLKYNNIKVLIFSFGEFLYGDCFNINGEIQIPSNAYQKYLLVQGVYGVFYYPEIKLLDLKKSNFFLEFVLFLKNNFRLHIRKTFDYPYSSFIEGLILGIRTEIPEDLMESFNKVGLTHILAISGYNISIIILFIFASFYFLSKGLRIFFSVIVIVFFVALIGFSASVVRAAIMGSISLLALFFGRNYIVFFSLLISVFLMTLFNPLSLIYDVAFHLSVLATLGIILFSDRLKTFFSFIPSKFMMRESLVMTLSAQILVLPYVIYRFSAFSVIAPLVNLFVLPFIPFLMFLSFFTVLFSYFSQFLSVFLSFFSFLIMKFIFSLVKFFSSFDFVYFQFDK